MKTSHIVIVVVVVVILILLLMPKKQPVIATQAAQTNSSTNQVVDIQNTVPNVNIQNDFPNSPNVPMIVMYQTPYVSPQVVDPYSLTNKVSL